MRKIIYTLLLLIFVAGLSVQAQEPGTSGVGDSLYPEFGNGGYEVKRYSLDLTVDPATSHLQAVAILDANATQDLSSFNLDFIGFEIAEITVNDVVAPFMRAGQELTITPTTPLPQGSPFKVMVRYSGIPEQITSVAAPMPAGWVIYEGGSYVLGQPDGAANYFPTNDHPLDKAVYEVQVTVPQPYEAVVNGILNEVIENADGSRTFHWQQAAPMASYLLTINIDDYELQEETSPGGIPIRNYFAADLEPDIRDAFVRQGQMLDYFSTLFGPYPFDVYGAVVVNQELGVALETQTLSIFGNDSSTGLIVAHEIVHQWFGNSVSVADWRDIWLNEGMATYGEALWMAQMRGPNTFQRWIDENYQYVSDALAHGDPIVAPGEPDPNDLFNDGVYIWGALVFHALRLEVGDETFFEILQTFQSEYQYRNASTADFIAVAEAVSGRTLTSFFEQWLYGDSLPPLPEPD